MYDIERQITKVNFNYLSSHTSLSSLSRLEIGLVEIAKIIAIYGVRGFIQSQNVGSGEFKIEQSLFNNTGLFTTAARVLSDVDLTTKFYNHITREINVFGLTTLRDKTYITVMLDVD